MRAAQSKHEGQVEKLQTVSHRKRRLKFDWLLLTGLPAYLIAASLVAACGPLPLSEEGTGATQTAAALDAVAEATLARLRETADQATALASTPSATPTPAPPTATPTVTPTPTPEAPTIEVSVDTNCRSGPGSAYPYLGALLVGERTEIVARSSVPGYWLVANPDRPGGVCWLWARYAKVFGSTDHLPVQTPAPSPTPEPGEIAGWVFMDDDDDGTWDRPGESPLSGQRFFLKIGRCPGGATLREHSSQPDGSFRIRRVPPGRYCLVHDPSQAALEPQQMPISLAEGERLEGLAFRRRP